jgi:hypothetical protein
MKSILCLIAALSFAFCAVNDNREAAIPIVKDATPVELRVWPESIKLSNAIDRQSMVAQVVYSNGVTVDVTEQARFTPTKNIIAFDGNYWLPQSDGKGQLVVSIGSYEQTVPVSVTGADAKPKTSFVNDVMPVFSRAGCNSGGCHGSARGKDGFQLSLFGFDPKGDYDRLTREIPGRRVDLAVPSECLLVAKATGAVPHTGGELFKAGSEHYNVLMDWLESGAAFDADAPPTVESIELYPESGVLNGTDQSQSLTVVASYADGTTRDVTSLAYFSTNNDNVATVSQNGIVHAKNRGEAFVMCRFNTHTVGRQFVVIPKDQKFEWSLAEPVSEIDQAIHDKLKLLRILPSGACDDRQFIRRVYLDICGILPTPDEVQQFVDDGAADKRSQCIDRLLQRDEFTDIWVMKWAELLQIRSIRNRVTYKGAHLFHEWLRSRLAENTPIDEVVRELLTASGETFESGPANYFHSEPNDLKLAENVAQAFLGMRIQCAQCHNHPFDRWTMEDYYGFAAFFKQIVRKRARDPREFIIYNRRSGEVKHPVSQAVVAPKFLGGDSPETKGKDRRAVLSDWITSTDNPYFAKNLANIVWAHFLGSGIVDEVDDVRVSNPPVNEALLEQLATKLKESNYDFRELIREICNSQTYQLSTKTNQSNVEDRMNFSHANLRRIRAEVLLDVISQVTETKNRFRGYANDARAVQIDDGATNNFFLKTFGRSTRESVCSCEVKMEPNLSQALHLLNGDSVNAKIAQGKVIEKLIAKKLSNRAIVNNLYQRCLGRFPTKNETKSLIASVTAEPDRKAALQDVFWSILNCREFIFNH